jgi:hypothetical protein
MSISYHEYFVSIIVNIPFLTKNRNRYSYCADYWSENVFVHEEPVQ